MRVDNVLIAMASLRGVVSVSALLVPIGHSQGPRNQTPRDAFPTDPVAFMRQLQVDDAHFSEADQ